MSAAASDGPLKRSRERVVTQLMISSSEQIEKRYIIIIKNKALLTSESLFVGQLAFQGIFDFALSNYVHLQFGCICGGKKGGIATISPVVVEKSRIMAQKWSSLININYD